MAKVSLPLVFACLLVFVDFPEQFRIARTTDNAPLRVRGVTACRAAARRAPGLLLWKIRDGTLQGTTFVTKLAMKLKINEK